MFSYLFPCFRHIQIGINYVGDNPGELRGCHNDVLNMKNYIMNVHGFEEENITVLMDDGEHAPPTYENMIQAYKKVVAESESGDAVFLQYVEPNRVKDTVPFSCGPIISFSLPRIHSYSGHGTKIRDDDFNEEEDGYDEALVPVDYKQSGVIRDDDLYEILIADLADGVHMVSLMDCCHSGTILDLPYIFKGDGQMQEVSESWDLDTSMLTFYDDFCSNGNGLFFSSTPCR